MEIYLSLLIDILEQGLIYGIMVLGVYISYRILNFPDLSVDGTFPLGAAVSTVMIMQGVNPWLALLVAMLAGCVAGLVTGLLHVYMKISGLFSGILVMTVMFSVNLIIVGKSNQPFFEKPTVFNTFPATLIPENQMYNLRVIFISLLIVLMCKILLDWFLRTKRGMLLRAVGDNPQVVVAVGISPGNVKIMGLSMANGLVSLSGAVLSQQQRFFEISTGTGMMVLSLASVIIGLVVFKRLSLLKATSMVILGSIIYKALVALAINFGAPANYLNLIRGVLFLLVLLLNQLSQKGEQRHAGN